MIKYSDLPVDSNGILHGVWRLVHADPNFAGDVGPVRMRDGLGLDPIAGRQVRYVVAEYGHKLFLEPWTEPLPKHFMVPELARVQVSDEEWAKLEIAPWRRKELDAMSPLMGEIDRWAEAQGRSAADVTDSVAAMVREAPTVTADIARAMRIEMNKSAEHLRGNGYVELPKVIASCIEQLDAIIAADARPSADPGGLSLDPPAPNKKIKRGS